ncbi:HSP20-like chaperone, partial [Mycotypha africana]|uniref:HSP20-like chaperone n=1 Tax=Mycotypha africana TaxID=64632 RepID=UPI0023018E9F
MALAHRLFQDALNDIQRAMDVFEQPLFTRHLSNPLTGSIKFDTVTPSHFDKLLASKPHPPTDLKETSDGYELHAEVPGYDKKNIKIEMPDSRTLILSGSMEKEHEQIGKTATTVKGQANEKDSHDEATKKAKSMQQDHLNNGQEVLQKEQADVAEEQVQSPEWWINERVYGSFKRTFNFPHPVDQDKVKATYENGILKIVVPKMTKGFSKLIDI